MAATPGEFARAYGNRWTTTLEQVIPALTWAAIRHRDGTPAEGAAPVLGADVAVDRSAAAVVACWPDTAGCSDPGAGGVRAGTDWVARPARRAARRARRPRWCSTAAPAPRRTVVDQLRDRRGELPPWVRAVTPREFTTACAQLLDAITDRSVRHRGDPDLDAAVGAAAKRTVGEGWAWSRRLPTVDVSPLIAASLALFGDRHRAPPPARPADLHRLAVHHRAVHRRRHRQTQQGIQGADRHPQPADPDGRQLTGGGGPVRRRPGHPQ